jgi:membrane-associated protein
MMLAGILTSLTDWLDKAGKNWWFLGVIFLLAYLDSVVPIVPSETAVIIGGVAAAPHVPKLLLVIVAAAIGAFLGDNTAYLIGRRASGWFDRRAARKPKFKARVDGATEQIRKRGGVLLVTARFIPGGRTVLTLASGITHQPRKWFVGWIAIATVIWGTYSATLGYIGGQAFEDNHTKAFVVAFSLAISMTVLIEVVRHFLGRSKKKRARAAAAVAAPPAQS